MKKIAMILTTVIIAATSFAQYNNGRYNSNNPYGNNSNGYSGYNTSQLAITTAGGYYMVNLDGRQFNVDQSGVMLNIGAGRHNIQIYRTQNNGGSILGSILGGNRRNQLIYNNDLMINSGQRIDLTVNNNGRVRARQTNLNNNNWNNRRMRDRDDYNRDNY
ncbi:MAG: hypothetical protein JWN76_3144 [Chitinophagaceae bacterium]|nr:hypothetical protein [Chitinophagaceae bacterium]